MTRLLEEAEEALGGDHRRRRVGERVELEGRAGEEVAVEDDADLPGSVVHDAEGGDGAGGEAEGFLELRGVREGEAPRAESFGEDPEVENPLRREDDEPGSALPILEEEVLAVAPRNVPCRDPRFAHGADRFVGNRAGLDAESGQEREQAWRVERSVLRGSSDDTIPDSEPGGAPGV